MDLDIAIKAIEYVINWRKEKSNLFNIWFYGGESLLRFDLIKKIVIYCNSIKKLIILISYMILPRLAEFAIQQLRE